jgi:hypothetical protein
LQSSDFEIDWENQIFAEMKEFSFFRVKCKDIMVCVVQCDQMGRNIAIWDIFFALGAFFQEDRPKFTLVRSKFGLLFVLNFPHFGQKFLWSKFLIY